MAKLFLIAFTSWCLVLTASFAYSQSLDFNADGLLDCADIDVLTREVAGGGNGVEFDLNLDGVVDRSDMSAWLIAAGTAKIGAPYILGDVVLAGVVDNRSYTGAWSSNKFTYANGYCDADVNGDGFVDVSDGLIIKANWGLMSSTSVGIGAGEMLIPSDLVRLIYDPTTGFLFSQTNSKITGIVVEGPEPTETLSFDSGYSNGTSWSAMYANGKHQWFGWEILPTLIGAQGTHLLARYPAGLSSSDFGVVEFGTFRVYEDLEGVFATDVEVAVVLPGDANLDGYVDVSDFNIWNDHKFSADGVWGRGDFNGDGLVDVADFNVWNLNKFTSSGWVGRNGLLVPEPSLTGFVCFLVMAVALRRERCQER